MEKSNFFGAPAWAHYRQQVLSVLITFCKSVPDWFFPPRCLGCNASFDPAPDFSRRDSANKISAGQNSTGPISAFFCESCLQEGYQVFAPPFCERCGRKFDSGIRENHLCGSCIKASSQINSVRAALVFDGIIRSGLHRFKYSGKLRAAAFFEPVLFQAFETFFQAGRIDLIIPIPLHITKLRTRGFNQAFILVRHFKKIYQKKHLTIPDWEIDPFCLDRTKKTAPQTGFTPKQRQQNIKNAFTVMRPAKIKGRRILLIDDVYTTGATATEAARTLLTAGAASVDVLVLARA